MFCVTLFGLAIAIFEMFCIPLEYRRKTSWMFYSTMLFWMTYFIATKHVERSRKLAFVIKTTFAFLFVSLILFLGGLELTHSREYRSLKIVSVSLICTVVVIINLVADWYVPDTTVKYGQS
jgi:hypothetical protein